MKTFKEFLVGLAEEDDKPESDAEYNKRMRKTAKTLKKNARKGKRNKKRNKIKRRTPEKLATAARAKAKREVLGKLTKMQPSAKKKKVERKADKIDRKTVKMTRVLKKQEPKRIKAARASRLKK